MCLVQYNNVLLHFAHLLSWFIFLIPLQVSFLSNKLYYAFWCAILFVYIIIVKSYKLIINDGIEQHTQVVSKIQDESNAVIVDM